MVENGRNLESTVVSKILTTNNIDARITKVGDS